MILQWLFYFFLYFQMLKAWWWEERSNVCNLILIVNENWISLFPSSILGFFLYQPPLIDYFSINRSPTLISTLFDWNISHHSSTKKKTKMNNKAKGILPLEGTCNTSIRVLFGLPHFCTLQNCRTNLFTFASLGLCCVQTILNDVHGSRTQLAPLLIVLL